MDEDATVVYVGGPRSGKTSRLVDWLKQGEPIGRYPFWSRIVLSATLEEAHRLRRDVLYNDPELAPRRESGEIDVLKWVFSVDEWRVAHFGFAHAGSLDVELAVDNADWVLRQFLRGPGKLSALTLTGTAVETDWPG